MFDDDAHLTFALHSGCGDIVNRVDLRTLPCFPQRLMATTTYLTGIFFCCVRKPKALVRSLFLAPMSHGLVGPAFQGGEVLRDS